MVIKICLNFLTPNTCHCYCRALACWLAVVHKMLNQFMLSVLIIFGAMVGYTISSKKQ